MSVEQILKYVANTPHNTNFSILRQMLEQLKAEGSEVVDALGVLAETGFIDMPVTAEDGSIYTNENGAIYTL